MCFFKCNFYCFWVICLLIFFLVFFRIFFVLILIYFLVFNDVISIIFIKFFFIVNCGEIVFCIVCIVFFMGICIIIFYIDIDVFFQYVKCIFNFFVLGLNIKGYFNGLQIIELVKKYGIEVFYFGYGFLSENFIFVQVCEDVGIVFVGLLLKVMLDMGDKVRSKIIMNVVGVFCVLGYYGLEQSVEELRGYVREIGYLVLLKSVKGGGGKGMRIVFKDEEFEVQIVSVRQEVRVSFGDGGEVMFVEKYVVRLRYVEVQVFVDRYGNCVVLGERDCSVQRRYQKILEESLVLVLDDVMRYDLWDKVRKVVLVVDYVGVGMVEFIFDKDIGKFYFMEMNMRLQVEYFVSEMVIGIDFVEWQFWVVVGERFFLIQDEIEVWIYECGVVIEVCIYVENFDKGFFFDFGKLVYLIMFKVSEDIRIDVGFVEGDIVFEVYDGMIVKLIVCGCD